MQRNKSCDMDRMPACERLETDLDVSLACMSEPDTAVDHGQDSTLCIPEPVQIADLPENVVRTIALHTLQSGGRQNSILSLLSMCGVCKRWRNAASCLTPGSSLLYDGMKATGTASSTMEQKYKTLPKQERTRILHAAAGLFRGTTILSKLCLSGICSGLHMLQNCNATRSSRDRSCPNRCEDVPAC